jgi:hypothetical protein
MTSRMLPLAELNVVAMDLLYRELGPADTARFLSQFTCGFGDYTQERDKLFGPMSVGEIAAEVRRKRDEKQGNRSRGGGQYKHEAQASGLPSGEGRSTHSLALRACIGRSRSAP